MTYILNYINTGEDTFQYDHTFSSMEKLMDFVKDERMIWTSLGIVILP